MDLSGPSNIKDTSITVFTESGRNRLIFHREISGADDIEILNLINQLKEEGDIITGIDAPLSYNNRGGDRPSDSELRKLLTSSGLRPGSVMVPTLTRMVYLTLRGISAARMLKQVCPGIKIAETHPGGAMALRGAPVEDVRSFKNSMPSRINLLKWMSRQGLDNIPADKPEDHFVASCACALGAWKWHKNEPAWICPAKEPLHPFDYVC